MRKLLTAALLSAPFLCAGSSPSEPLRHTVVRLNDNGGWCWFQDERAIIDADAGTMLIGSVATSEGAGGAGRGGNLEVVSYELASGETRRVTLDRIAEDDHGAPALLLRPDGRYVAMYTEHGADMLTRYRISTTPHDASRWDPVQVFDWSSAGSDFPTTYSNLFSLSAENRVYAFARAHRRSPNALVSTDQGAAWSFLGTLTASDTVGYVNGYFKYASQGIDRIDFIATEHHPRDYDTSIYHGFLRDGALHRSDGTVVDASAFRDQAPRPDSFTQVFAAGSQWGGETMTRAWPSDMHVDADGKPYALFTCRANDVPPNSRYDDHRFFYARFDGRQWRTHQLAKAGPPLTRQEQDYTGLGALVPGDPSAVYISTPIDPRDGTRTARYEIYRGTSGDGGATWRWTPITHGSSVDNLRPIVPLRQGGHQPLLWLRGTMRAPWDYQLEVVAIMNPDAPPSSPRATD